MNKKRNNFRNKKNLIKLIIVIITVIAGIIGGNIIINTGEFRKNELNIEGNENTIVQGDINLGGDITFFSQSNHYYPEVNANKEDSSTWAKITIFDKLLRCNITNINENLGERINYECRIKLFHIGGNEDSIAVILNKDIKNEVVGIDKENRIVIKNILFTVNNPIKPKEKMEIYMEIFDPTIRQTVGECIGDWCFIFPEYQFTKDKSDKICYKADLGTFGKPLEPTLVKNLC